MAPDDTPTAVITLEPDLEPDLAPEPEARRRPRARAVLALGVVLLGATAPAAQASSVTDTAGARPTGVATTDGRAPALPPRATGAITGAITDVWGRGAGTRR